MDMGMHQQEHGHGYRHGHGQGHGQGKAINIAEPAWTGDSFIIRRYFRTLAEVSKK
jgi:hypothetical protein